MGKKVLIVDDLPEIRDLFRRGILEPLGFEVLEAHTIEQAWALFQENHNELAGIMMDGELPERTDELVRKIKALGVVPIIAMSGRRNPELLEAGCDAAVEKTGGLASVERAVLRLFRR